MRAGILNEIVEIYTPDTSVNMFGEETTQFLPSCSTRARVVNDSGNRTNQNGEIFYEYTKTFYVRRYINVNEFDRIKWNGKFYRILDINPNRHDNQITIKGELVND